MVLIKLSIFWTFFEFSGIEDTSQPDEEEYNF